MISCQSPRGSRTTSQHRAGKQWEELGSSRALGPLVPLRKVSDGAVPFTVYGACPLGGFSRWSGGKESAWHCRRCKRYGFDPWVGKIPWRREWQPLHSSFLETPTDRRALEGVPSFESSNSPRQRAKAPLLPPEPRPLLPQEPSAAPRAPRRHQNTSPGLPAAPLTRLTSHITGL